VWDGLDGRKNGKLFEIGKWVLPGTGVLKQKIGFCMYIIYGVADLEWFLRRREGDRNRVDLLLPCDIINKSKR